MKVRKLLSFCFLVFILTINAPNSTAAQTTGTTLSLPVTPFNFVVGVGTVAGKVTSAKTGEALEHVTVCQETLCSTTNDRGEYQIEGIPAGSQWMSAQFQEFVSSAHGVLVQANKVVTSNFALHPNILGVENIAFRMVLTWSETPSWPDVADPQLEWNNDLDIHVWMDGTTPMHIEAPANTDLCTSYPNTCIELDAQRGSGPETVAVRFIENTIYHFAVLNTNQLHTASVPPITLSRAQLHLFDENGLRTSFVIPTYGNGNLWYVFKMEPGGSDVSIEPTNCILDYSTLYVGDTGQFRPPRCP